MSHQLTTLYQKLEVNRWKGFDLLLKTYLKMSLCCLKLLSSVTHSHLLTKLWISLPHITFLFPWIFLMCVMFHFLSFLQKRNARHLHHPSLYEPMTQSASAVIFKQTQVGKLSTSERLLNKQSRTVAIISFITCQTKTISFIYIV